MRSSIHISLIIIIVAVTFAVQAWASPAPLHVMIDPGHGGSDTGAARGEIRESEITLKIGLYLAEYLKHDKRFKISMTRTRDEKISLSKRTSLAHKAGADIFISIHLNSSKDPRAHGTEIYFQNQLPADEEALYLVSREHFGDDEKPQSTEERDSLSKNSDLKLILEDLHRNHRIRESSRISKTLYKTLAKEPNGPRLGSRAVRQAPFHVVSYIDIPSILVELGFITHAQEGPRLTQTTYQKELARLLADGLIKYKVELDTGNSPSP